MKISAKCLTYGRVPFLEEALYSFLSQENSEEDELVIVNDYPLQTLVFDHPRVKIFNLKETFDTIGKKENFAIEQCTGELIATWDDDDIALPWHLDNIRYYMDKDTDLLLWANGVYYNEPDITALTSLGNSGFVFTKKAWEQAGKSPVMNAGGDMVFVNKLKELGNITYAFPEDEKVSWFYRWSLPQNGGVYHQSGMGTDTPDRPNVVIRNAAHVEFLRKKGLVKTGTIELQPKWNKDYIKMLQDFIKK